MVEFKKKPVQLVRHLHEVLTGYHKEVARGSKYMVQTKYDGVYGFAIHEETGWRIYGRTGKKLSNVGHLEADLAGASKEQVFIGEIICPSRSLEELSGIVNPNRTNPVDELPVIRFMLHDLIPREHFLDGHSPVHAKLRYRLLQEHFKEMQPRPELSRPVACKFDVDEVRIRLIAEGLITAGHEGVVVKREGADWKAGRKNHESVKIVRGCDYDLMCIGIEEGEGKRQGMVANAVCVWRRHADPDAEIMRISVDLGKGFTDERRIALFKDPAQIVGHVLEVHALQVGSQGSLRLPKVNSIRIDKTVPDL